MDKKPVTMLSTIHTNEMVTLQLKHKEIKQIKPKVVGDYNFGMKGVDLSDQIAQSYPVTRKTLKWFKKIFFYLLDMTVINSLSVHKVLGGKMLQAEFKFELVRGLLQQGEQTGRKRNPPSRIPVHPLPPAAADTPADIHMPEDTPLQKWKRCSHCWKQDRQRKETRIKFQSVPWVLGRASRSFGKLSR